MGKRGIKHRGHQNKEAKRGSYNYLIALSALRLVSYVYLWWKMGTKLVQVWPRLHVFLSISSTQNQTDQLSTNWHSRSAFEMPLRFLPFATTKPVPLVGNNTPEQESCILASPRQRKKEKKAYICSLGQKRVLHWPVAGRSAIRRCRPAHRSVNGRVTPRMRTPSWSGCGAHARCSPGSWCMQCKPRDKQAQAHEYTCWMRWHDCRLDCPLHAHITLNGSQCVYPW